MRRYLVLFAFALSLFLTAYAHPGRTDSNGGHYDRSDGTYHYHHGYPAHRHTNGLCPYNFDDKTGETSGESGTNRTKGKTREHTLADSVGRALVGIFGVGAVGLVCFGIKAHLDYKNEERRKAEEQQKSMEEKRRQQEIERRRLVELYSANDIETIAGVPHMYIIGADGLPEEREKEEGEVYGKTLEVYINDGSSSYSYHRKGCRFAKRMVNILDPKYDCCSRNACGVCRPMDPPKINWFKKYLEAETKCAELGIQPKHRGK